MGYTNWDDLNNAIGREARKVDKQSTGKDSASADIDMTPAEIRSMLSKEAKKLEEFIIFYIKRYLDSYTPTVYVREQWYPPSSWVDSLVVRPVKKDGNKYSVTISFDREKADHPSVIDASKYPMGYTPWLMEVGWGQNGQIATKLGYHAYMFTEHPGAHYVKKAIDQYKKIKPKGLKIDVNNPWTDANYIYIE